MKQLILVFFGGGLGSVLRYVISKYLNATPSEIPYGTFTVNIFGCLLIGLILGLAFKSNTLTENQTLLLATGFCGGFTTFSSFAFENHTLLKSGDLTHFAFYTIGSIVLGLVAVFLGLYFVKGL
ncbi:fluoride efflux transporter CrcB [Mangrovimonas aestuarii]|uniref:fluoride efflux transporter CrcB n=1 Tax=Mangrovimonas aestuarii TaxID=3018443 RepID=UPI002377D803|nr:fluoride efflux transporter CrcB [Mangrovimonas aestuarii]